MSNVKEKIKELTLLLLYLNSLEENELGLKYRRAWKGFDFDVLDELSDDEFIYDSNRLTIAIV